MIRDRSVPGAGFSPNPPPIRVGYGMARVGYGMAVGLALLLGALPVPARAHGGQYRSPAAPPEETGDPGKKGRTPTALGWEAWWWAVRDRTLEGARRLPEEEDRAVPTGSGLAEVGASRDPPAAPAVPPPAPEADSVLREVLPALTRALADPEAEVRSAAAVALGKVGQSRSLLPLHGALRDDHPDVKDAALLALGLIRDPLALDALRDVLFDPGTTDRMRGFAALAVGLTGGAEASALLVEFLDPAADGARVGGLRRSEDVLACAVTGLGRTGDPAAAVPLRRLFASPSLLTPKCRCLAGISLARLGDRGAVPLLLQGLAHEDARFRQTCAVALGMAAVPGDPAATEALLRVARADSDASARRFALHALADLGGEPALAFLRETWRTGRGEDRLHAALALGRRGDVLCAPSILAALREEGSQEGRGALSLALGMMRHAPAEGDLLELAGKGLLETRAHALSALGLLGGKPAAAAARTALLEERDPLLRFAAARCLRTLGDRSAVAPLVAAATGGGGVQERSQACYFLGVLGGREARAVLLRLAEDRAAPMPLRMHAVAGLGVLADRSPVPVLADMAADTNFLLPVGPLEEIRTFL